MIKIIARFSSGGINGLVPPRKNEKIFRRYMALHDLADRNASAIVWELIKDIYAICIIYKQQDWFGAGKFFQNITVVLIVYFIVSAIVTAWFVVKHKKEDMTIGVST
ncbi:MAG: hypothetical protein QM763_20890 [Agriterribacter sp.]